MRAMIVTMILIVATMTATASEESRIYRIACIGDSITMGRYPAELEKLFGGAAEVRAYGREGANVAIAFEYVHRAFYYDKFKPTHVIWYAGINDCVLHKSSIARIEHVLHVTDCVVNRAVRGGIKPIVVQHHPWDASKYDRTPIGPSCSRSVNKELWFEEVMSEGAQLVDTSSLGYEQREACCDYYGWEGCLPVEGGYPCHRGGQLMEAYDAGDGLHLNLRGEKELARLIYEQVEW